MDPEIKGTLGILLWRTQQERHAYSLWQLVGRPRLRIRALTFQQVRSESGKVRSDHGIKIDDVRLLQYQ